MNTIEFFHANRRIKIIWLSTIAESKTIKEISRFWGYGETSGSLYDIEMIEESFKKKILNFGAFPGRKNQYKALLDWIFSDEIIEYMREHKKPETHIKIIQSIIKNDDYKKFLKNDKTRSFLFNLENIKLFFKDARTIRREKEIIYKVLLLPLMVFVAYKNRNAESFNLFINLLSESLEMGDPIFFKNMIEKEEDLKGIFQDLPKSLFQKFNHLLVN